MSKPGKELLIIFEEEAEQWASYMRTILAKSVPETGICCYNITKVSSRRDNFLELNGYKCKLLILSRGMLEGMCQLYRFFLARVLRPEACVVVLLCGVESLDPLLELIPLKGEECLQISSEQDAQEYRSAVLDIIRRGGQMSAVDTRITQEPKLERRHSAGARSSLLVLPTHVPCENPGEVFLLLRQAVASKGSEVEFSGSKQKVRVKPTNWNESTLSVTAAEFPAGNVCVTLYCGGVVKGSTHLHYYNTMGEISRLLKQAADPMNFMCQAFQSSSEKLDHILAACVVKKMPTGGFQGLQTDQTPAGVSTSEDIPTLLHFAAQYGLKDLASVLLQCPGAQQAMRSTNRYGHTPLMLAHANGHSQLQVLLQESLAKSSDDDTADDTSVYEMMGSTVNLRVADSRDQPHTGGAGDVKVQVDNDEDDDPYKLEVNDEEYDTILTSSSTTVMTNRPPAPAPRPESLPSKEENMPYIAQVFQKKMSQGDTETLYSLPAKQTSGQDSCTYDTFMPGPAPGLDELIKLQEQVKKGSLSVDEALERFSDWQRVQRGLDGIQQEKLRHLRASIMNNREDDESVYDKINIVHHTPPATTKECRRGSQQAEGNFYSKPVKGQHIYEDIFSFNSTEGRPGASNVEL